MYEEVRTAGEYKEDVTYEESSEWVDYEDIFDGRKQEDASV